MAGTVLGACPLRVLALLELLEGDPAVAESLTENESLGLYVEKIVGAGNSSPPDPQVEELLVDPLRWLDGTDLLQNDLQQIKALRRIEWIEQHIPG